jgi:hypothetical protein
VISYILFDKITFMQCCHFIRYAVYLRAFVPEMCFKKFKEDSVQVPIQRSRIPSFRLDNPIMLPDAHQCPEVSNCSRLHPFGHLSNVSGHSSMFDKKSDFLLRHRYGKTAATVRTLSLIWQDMEKNCNRPDVKATSSKRQSLL